jgi:hypothetical protein
MRGIQAAGIFNLVEGELAGAQFTSVYNFCTGDGRWLQVSGVMNAITGSFRGVQIASVNVATEDVHGAQFGYFNGAGALRGVQVGFANFAGPVHGLQLGLWNSSRRMDGVPVGVVNLAANGSHDWVAFASNYALFSAGVRTAVNGWYSMFTAGVNDLEDSRGDTAFLSWHYGHAWRVGGQWSVGGDVGIVHAMPRPSNEPGVNDDLHFALQPRVIAERGHKGWRVFAGAGMSAIFSSYASDATVDYSPLGLFGVSKK